MDSTRLDSNRLPPIDLHLNQRKNEEHENEGFVLNNSTEQLRSNRNLNEKPKIIDNYTSTEHLRSNRNLNEKPKIIDHDTSTKHLRSNRNINEVLNIPNHNNSRTKLRNEMSNNNIRADLKSEDNLQDAQEDVKEGFGLCGYCLIGFSYFLFIITFPLAVFACVKIVTEYERAVILRLGRKLPGGAKGPGLFFILPCIDDIIKVDLRTVTFDIAPQEILTKDSVTVTVDGVCYFRVFNPVISIVAVENAKYSTMLLAATTLRNILGTRTLQEILREKDAISNQMQELLDVATDPWGIKVERVELKDVRLPHNMQRAMATEAEATREARAKVISAEGEQKASVALKEAADVISQSPVALQLRYLQTLTNISAEKNSTIIFPIPIEMMSRFVKK